MDVSRKTSIDRHMYQANRKKRNETRCIRMVSRKNSMYRDGIEVLKS